MEKSHTGAKQVQSCHTVQWSWLGWAWSAGQVRRPLLSAKVHTPHAHPPKLNTNLGLCKTLSVQIFQLIFVNAANSKLWGKRFSTSHLFVTRTFSIASLWNWWDWSQLAALTRMLFACFPSSSVWEPVVRVGGCTWAEARWSLFTNPATSNWGKRGVWATPTTRPRNPKCAVSVKLFVMLLFTRKTCL